MRLEHWHPQFTRAEAAFGSSLELRSFVLRRATSRLRTKQIERDKIKVLDMMIMAVDVVRECDIDHEIVQYVAKYSRTQNFPADILFCPPVQRSEQSFRVSVWVFGNTDFMSNLICTCHDFLSFKICL